ncbi:MAG: hypothetical protein RLZZ78_124 [Armatimonadota bacterium]
MEHGQQFDHESRWHRCERPSSALQNRSPIILSTMAISCAVTLSVETRKMASRSSKVQSISEYAITSTPIFVASGVMRTRATSMASTDVPDISPATTRSRLPSNVRCTCPPSFQCVFAAQHRYVARGNHPEGRLRPSERQHRHIGPSESSQPSERNPPA